MKRILLCFIVAALFNGCSTDNPTPPALTVTDCDGNIYNTVTIGTQVWMVENLKTTKYRNCDSIPYIYDNAEWANSVTGAQCTYSNDPGNANIYGRLYNWYAINDPRGIAPAGWHIPSYAEWETLANYLGGTEEAGGKMKEIGTNHWLLPNFGATNSSGFTSLPGGIRGSTGFSFKGEYAFWHFSGTTTPTAYNRWNSHDSTKLGTGGKNKYDGSSIRCIKD